jgi:bifunctional enzyme CysN/CysC
MTSSNVTWHEGQIAPDERSEILRSRGATLWITGLSGSGKSTLASAVEKQLVLGGRGAYLLDGDNLRTGLNSDLGFTRESRQENARRTAEVARLFADAGLVAIVALISPYAESRRWARQLHHRAGLPFAEIYMEASVDLCATRDAKGLYAQVTRGSISSFTGVDDPYEVPDSPDLVIEPGTSVDEAVAAVVGTLDSIESVGFRLQGSGG